jgi:hypothetical protein
VKRKKLEKGMAGYLLERGWFEVNPERRLWQPAFPLDGAYRYSIGVALDIQFRHEDGVREEAAHVRREV